MSKKTLPIFIPHLGCPHDCLFCDQHTITSACAPSPTTITAQITEYLSTCTKDATVELAFFGGSFTALPYAQVESYLSAATPFLKSGQITGIRCSTRPDAITTEILQLLKHYGVTTIEIGVQSMSDAVLRAVCRGHTAAHSIAAARAILDAGFSLVGQMMLGLPGSSPADELATADAIIAMGASAVRIYPTVVLPGTGLAALQASGAYVLPTKEEMVARGADVLSRFVAAGVSVLRIGLCANEYLASEDAITGYHPAMGELIRSLYYRRKLENILSAKEYPSQKKITVLVPRGAASQVAGQHSSTRTYIQSKFGITLSIVEREQIPPYQLEILYE